MKRIKLINLDDFLKGWPNKAGGKNGFQDWRVLYCPTGRFICRVLRCTPCSAMLERAVRNTR